MGFVTGPSCSRIRPAAIFVLLGSALAFGRQQDSEKPASATDPGIIVVPKRKPRPAAEQPPPAEPSAESSVPPVVPDRKLAPPAEPPRRDPPAPTNPADAPEASKAAPASTPDARDPGRPAALAERPVTERLLSRKLGSERFNQLLKEMESAQAGGNGQGAPSASTFWDRARPRTGDDAAVRPSGTQFFSGQIRPATPSGADATKSRYGNIPGGVVLEGVAKPISQIDKVSYDPRFNAVMINDSAAYFVKIPPKTFAVMCRAIAEDDKERVGVSLGSTHIVYGKVPESSTLAWDLKLADHFLGDIVFVYRTKEDHWTAGYKFAKDYTPEPYTGTEPHHCAVFFTFNGFQFDVDQEEIKVARANLDVQLIPLLDTKAADGGHLPDNDAMSRNDLPKEWMKNAAHVAENISYYRREQIIARVYAYGEAAALLRGIKAEGFDLVALAARITGREF